MTNVFMNIFAWFKSEQGQGLVEYAGIVGLIAVAIGAVAALGLLEGPLTNLINGIGDCVDWDDGTGCGPA